MPDDELVLDSKICVDRRALARPCGQHFKNSGQPQDGVLYQVDTVNQFAQYWMPLIKEFTAPSATCGYMAMANALVLQKTMPASGIWSQAEFDEVVKRLCDPVVLEPYIRQAMNSVSCSRTAWIAKDTTNSFTTASAQFNYLSDWVANYEISDFFRDPATSGDLNGCPIYFLRHNQWPEYSVLTHEEKERLLEEEQFGAEAAFIVESFSPERQLQRPEVFLQSLAVNQKPPAAPCIFIADLTQFAFDPSGHFVTCVAVHLESPNKGVEPALIVFNTIGGTNGGYLNKPGCAFAFDLAYPPET